MLDERFILHRFKATRLSTLIGTVLMVLFFTYRLVVDKTIQWEYVIVLTAMSVTKLAALFYFRRTN